ncbi:MAG TPA: HAD family hydrolase [Rhodocyclaceae bacterium]
MNSRKREAGYPLRTMLKALIFDVDGTLADTERDGHRVAFNAAFREAGLPWNWDIPLYGKLLAVSGGKERLAHYAREVAPELASRPDFDAFLRKLHTLKTGHYVRLVASGAVELRPGVANLIREARKAGLKLAIASTTSPENVSALLRSSLAYDAEKWFDVIGAGDVVPAKKPAPDIYLWVLERLGVAADECMVVEDSANGVRAACAAGIPTLVTENAYTRGQDFTGAVAVLPDLGATILAEVEVLHRAYSQDH